MRALGSSASIGRKPPPPSSAVRIRSAGRTISDPPIDRGRDPLLHARPRWARLANWLGAPRESANEQSIVSRRDSLPRGIYGRERGNELAWPGQAARFGMNDPSVPGTKAVSTIYIGKWAVPILYCLREKTHRHGELRRRLGRVSHRMLTRTLKNLESTGLIARRVTHSSPLAVEYSLTKIGRSLLASLSKIRRWVDLQNKGVNAVLHFVRTDLKGPMK